MIEVAISSQEFKVRVAAWSERLRVSPSQVRIQRMTRKWASCSTNGWVSFATDLLDMEPAFQDYVIVHELLHLKIPNHGRVFRSLLSAYVPGWQRLGDACVRVKPLDDADEEGVRWLLSKETQARPERSGKNERVNKASVTE